MRLRDISERVREVMEGAPEELLMSGEAHGLVQDIRDVQTAYRPIQASGKNAGVVSWLAFSFDPFIGLIEPFNIFPGRFWALTRMHRQPSGLPELVVHIARELPDSREPLAPDLYASFSNSPNVETTIKQIVDDSATLRFFHSGSLMEADRTILPAEFCLPGIEQAIPEGFIDDQIPGLIEDGKTKSVFLGDLVFYNQGRTADRRCLRTFLLNCVSVGVVYRYVRGIVRKSMDQA